MSEEALLAEKRARTFERQDQEERREAARRKEEWEEVQESALGRRVPEEMKRSRFGDSTVGGVCLSSTIPLFPLHPVCGVARTE